MPGFNSRDSRRIARQIRRKEVTPLFNAGLPTGPTVVWPSKLAITSSSVSAWTAGTMGTGTAVLQILKPDGTYTATTFSVTVMSMSTTTIPTSTLVVIDVVDGQWVITVVIC